MSLIDADEITIEYSYPNNGGGLKDDLPWEELRNPSPTQVFLGSCRSLPGSNLGRGMTLPIMWIDDLGIRFEQEMFL